MKYFQQLVTTLIYSKTILTSWKIFGFNFQTMLMSKTQVSIAFSNRHTTKFTSAKSSRIMLFRKSLKKQVAGQEHQMLLKYSKSTQRRLSRLNKIVNSYLILMRIFKRRPILSSILMSMRTSMFKDYNSNRNLKRENRM